MDSRLLSYQRRKGLVFARGFSLIELLVSIAVVAILASIAYAVTGNVLERSRLLQCTSSLRQWGQGILQYTTEHGGVLPQYNEDINDMDRTQWQEVIAPYVVSRSPSGEKNRYLLRRDVHCPGDSKKEIGVIYNCSHHIRPETAGRHAPRTLEDIQYNLSSFLLLSENYTGGFWETLPWLGGSSNPYRIDYTRHNRGGEGVANFLFADFHIEALTYEEALERGVIVSNR